MSKKLEKNGLWESSRMMLPEHREALVRRTQPEPEQPERPNVPTREELGSCALLPVMLSIVETSGRTVAASTSPLKKLYMTATQVLMNLIHADLVQVKKELKARNIRVCEDERIDGAIRYRFICRGYEDSLSLIRDVVRAEIGVKLGSYINVMAKILTGEKGP
jgi:hypothetical protein